MTRTLFAIPKAFSGSDGTIQRNAIGSWAALRPRPLVVLGGDEPGTARAAADAGVAHLPEVEYTADGAPRLDSLFDRVRARHGADTLCYVNSDIILLDDFLPALEAVEAACSSFLMVSTRWDLDVVEPIDFADGWQARLRAAAAEKGRMGAVEGTDFFAFSSDLFQDLPPFAIGRCAWDNWMMGEPIRRGGVLVDATPALEVVHQNHDYRHIGGVGSGGMESIRLVPDAVRNLALAGGASGLFTTLDATHMLTPGAGGPVLVAAPRRRRAVGQVRRGRNIASQRWPRAWSVARAGASRLSRSRSTTTPTGASGHHVIARKDSPS